MRLLAWMAGLAPLALALSMLRCDSGAVAIDGCRQIESKRCEVAVGCPELGVVTQSDVVECQLFYRDQCLFGIADDASGPDDASVALCLEAIGALATCMGAANLAECTTAPPLADDIVLADTRACDVLRHPEQLDGCAFLRAVPQAEGGAGAGGEGGEGGAGGSAGAAGAGG